MKMFGKNFSPAKKIRLFLLWLMAVWGLSGCGSFGYQSIGFSLHNDSDKILYNPWIKTDENKYVYGSSLKVMPFKKKVGGGLNIFEFKRLPKYLLVGWKYGVDEKYIEKKSIWRSMLIEIIREIYTLVF